MVLMVSGTVAATLLAQEKKSVWRRLMDGKTLAG
jgi:hypothetical protein